MSKNLTAEDMTALASFMEGRYVEHKDIPKLLNEHSRQTAIQINMELKPQFDAINKRLDNGNREFEKLNQKVDTLNYECIRRSAICPHLKSISERPFEDHNKSNNNLNSNPNKQSDFNTANTTWKEITAWVLGGLALIGAVIAIVFGILSQSGG